MATMPSTPSAHPNLTRTEAHRRAQRVSAVSYALDLALDAPEEGYRGKVVVEFDMERPEATHLDYQGREVLDLKVNGATLSARGHRNHRIPLPAASLRAGRNQVEVRFASAYDNDGAGLHRAEDPVDGRSYLYTVFSPFDANRVLPCFDQPDMKATLDLRVTAPASWMVLAATPRTTTWDQGDSRVHVFAPTPRLSTYLFNLCAGPWASWRDPHAPVASRIFAAQSMREFVDTEELFRITRDGFEFFQRYFELPYPFEKYDQVFCPHFNWGAMENVGCVLHSDAMLFRHRPTLRERIDRADTLVHELSHMWFGNLVTMVWWNDLWLNESFATYMANLCLAEATEFGEEAWLHFALDIKSWAMWQDGLASTHPIETPVPDTDTTFTNFDGITYGKGAASLKQLAFHLGPEVFRRGVARYLRTHAWSNARCRDFLACLGAEAGMDLEDWERAWLRTSGVNTLRPLPTVKDGKLQALRIEQEAGNGDATLRPHRLELSLFSRPRGGGLELELVTPVEVRGARTAVRELEGRRAPALLFANHEDQAYARVLLDPASLKVARRHLSELPSPLLRAGVWQAAWHMVRDASTPPGEFLDLFVRQAAAETDAAVLHAAWVDLAMALGRYLPEAAAARAAAKLARLAWGRLGVVPPGGDLQSIWFDVAVALSRSPAQLARLEGALAGEALAPELDLDQERRWAVVTRLAVLGRRGVAARITGELERDGSERGHQAAYRARVALPELAGKQEAWERFLEDRKSPLGLLRSGMAGFWWPEQRELLRPFATRFFRDLERLEGRSGFFLNAYMPTLFPTVLVEPGVLRQARAALKAQDGASMAIRRPLAEAVDELQRALKIRSRAGVDSRARNQ